MSYFSSLCLLAIHSQVIVTSFLIGLGGPLANFILTIIGIDPTDPKQNLIDAAKIIVWCLRVFPPFNLGKGLFNAINIQFFDFLEGGGEISAWSEPILLYEIYFLAAESIVYLILAVSVIVVVLSFCLTPKHNSHCIVVSFSIDSNRQVVYQSSRPEHLEQVCTYHYI
jgi:hypothetical protein